MSPSSEREPLAPRMFAHAFTARALAFRPLATARLTETKARTKARRSLVVSNVASSGSPPSLTAAEMYPALYDPAQRDAKYGGNIAQYLVDCHDTPGVTFNFCGGMMFGLVLSPALREHLGEVAAAGPDGRAVGALLGDPAAARARLPALRSSGARRRRGASYKPVAAARAPPEPVAAAAHAPVDEAPPRRAVAAPRAAAVAGQGKPAAAEAPGARGPLRLRVRPHAAAARR